MQLRGKIVPHLGNIAILLAAELNTEAIRLQGGSGCSGSLDSLVANCGRRDLRERGLLGPRAVPPSVFMVEEHARCAPHSYIGTTLWH